jgi:hypothetical protein
MKPNQTAAKMKSFRIVFSIVFPLVYVANDRNIVQGLCQCKKKIKYRFYKHL